MSYIIPVLVGIMIYFIMRHCDFGRLSAQIVAVSGPGIGIGSAYLWEEFGPIIGLVFLILTILMLITILFVVISAEIDD